MGTASLTKVGVKQGELGTNSAVFPPLAREEQV